MPKESDIFNADELSENELSLRWRQESQRYVTEVNRFIQKGLQDGWENVPESAEPKDKREPMATAVLDAIRRANESGNVDDLHNRFPRAHGPFIGLIEKNAQSLPVVLLLNNGQIVLRIGSPFENGRFVIIDGDKVEPLSSDIISIGRSSNHELFAFARHEGVTIQEGWGGPVRSMLKWPQGNEGVPNGFTVDPNEGPPTITKITPFDTGDKALLVSPEGVFILTKERAFRLLPTKTEMKEHFEWLKKEYPEDPPIYDLSMEHGAISPDGTLITAGHQSSMHFVFDATTLEVVSEIGPMSEYPHFSVFSSDGKLVAFNSCHFYNGMTIGVPTRLLPGLKTEAYEPDDRFVQLEEGSRVYAAVTRDDEFIVGDASGYLRAFDVNGNFRWQHFIGSSVGDIDISRDGKQLVVTTYAGFLSIIDLDTGETDPFAIGTATHLERRRWLFWKNESKPLMW
ncbi:MAG TPA: hypothetical protein DDZ90_30370 [Planctomycetaceae bacterium]|nr:hypothetical protein [Gimesia sp.]HBL47700.1 hypothetical protein [Planctomycetaceae bacterium]